MTDAEALDVVLARTKHEAFRDPAMIETVRELAARFLAEPPPPPWAGDAPPTPAPLPPVLPEPAAAWRSRIATCLYRDPPGSGCGCQSAKCWATSLGRGLNGFVGDRDCHDCLDAI